jgi:hypothetical protein
MTGGGQEVSCPPPRIDARVDLGGDEILQRAIGAGKSYFFSSFRGDAKRRTRNLAITKLIPDSGFALTRAPE